MIVDINQQPHRIEPVRVFPRYTLRMLEYPHRVAPDPFGKSRTHGHPTAAQVLKKSLNVLRLCYLTFGNYQNSLPFLAWTSPTPNIAGRPHFASAKGTRPRRNDGAKCGVAP